MGALVIVVVIVAIGGLIVSRLIEERRKRREEHDEWMTRIIGAAARPQPVDGSEDQSKFRETLRRAAAERWARDNEAAVAAERVAEVARVESAEDINAEREDESYTKHVLDKDAPKPGAERVKAAASRLADSVREMSQRAADKAAEAARKQSEQPNVMLGKSPYERKHKEQEVPRESAPKKGTTKEQKKPVPAKEAAKSGINSRGALERYRIHGLYAILVIAGISFVPEVQEKAKTLILESWAWFIDGGEATIVWLGNLYIRASVSTSGLSTLVLEHFTTIWQSTALLVLAAFFFRSSERMAGSAGVVACVAIAGYLCLREYSKTTISNVPLAELCQTALDYDKRDWDATFPEYVARAKAKGLTLQACRDYLGIKLPSE